MHKVFIPEEIAQRGRDMRGGRAHMFETLDMSRTTHIIVDLQVGFVAEGAPVEVPVTREIIGNVNAISDAVRSAGGLNVFLRFTYDPDEPQTWEAFYKAYCSTKQEDLMRKAFTPGAPDFELWPGLDVADEDLIVDKTRFSGLIPGTSDLHDILQDRGIDTLIITGTVTNCCCESTARDALQMGYKIVFMSDGNAALTDAEHNGTLMSMSAIFADVMDTAHLLGVIEKSQGEKLALAG
jgi:ureidoacrylate peracid hydrolase